MDVGSSVAGSGILAAVIGLLWGVRRMMQRSQCEGHSGCCDISIDRAAEALEKTKTERDDAHALIKVLVAELGIRHKKNGESSESLPLEENTVTVELKIDDSDGFHKV